MYVGTSFSKRGCRDRIRVLLIGEFNVVSYLGSINPTRWTILRS